MLVFSLFLPATARLPPEHSAWELVKDRCQQNPNATYPLEGPLRGDIELNGTENNVVNCQQIDHYSLSLEPPTKTTKWPIPVFLLATGLFIAAMWRTYRKDQLHDGLVSMGTTLGTIAIAIGVSTFFSLPYVANVLLVLAVFFVPEGYILKRRDEIWSGETLLLMLVPLVVILLVLAIYMTFIGYTYTPLSAYFAAA